MLEICPLKCDPTVGVICLDGVIVGGWSVDKVTGAAHIAAMTCGAEWRGKSLDEALMLAAQEMDWKGDNDGKATEG